MSTVTLEEIKSKKMLKLTMHKKLASAKAELKKIQKESKTKIDKVKKEERKARKAAKIV
ncbi:MAG: hypothetical protein ACR2LL_00475 [Nitrosopumilus sp.]|uniref:hypothetical protein n=1 Tax=Nitrosopumilus sp. TaxID=2024843 RepID=UPI00292F1BD6|nr:hypothetical protein [Nitrosopumilus sp.]